MTDRPWYTDPRMLDAGDARRLGDRSGPPTPSIGPADVPDLAARHLSALHVVDPNTLEQRTFHYAGSVVVQLDGHDIALRDGETRLAVGLGDPELVGTARSWRHRRPGLIARLLTRKR